VTTNDLYETYPRFHLDVAREQDALTSHDVVCLQHPIYWYSMPPLLKLWIDEVFALGFAYGPGGTALSGKRFQLSITTGGGPDAYTEAGYHEHPLSDFLLPALQTARLCKMEYLEPMVLHGAGRASDAEIEAHAERVRDRLLHLTNPLYRGEGAGG
jgi:glutathione-regulated potassium-efflux system ancillary protein KefF